MREEIFVESTRCASTPDEAWTLRKPLGPGRQAYAAAAEFVGRHLGQGDGRSCLVVGSPIFEARMLIGDGWDVTYLDVRVPPVKLPRFVRSDATVMPLSDESFDALSSTCVLSHVGMGRYGDPLVENGDEKALAHMARVLKPDGIAVIMFGNVAAMPCVVTLGKCHRIYTMDECRRMLDSVHLKIEEVGLWSLALRKWFDDEKDITPDFSGNPDYVSFKVRKC